MNWHPLFNTSNINSYSQPVYKKKFIALAVCVLILIIFFHPEPRESIFFWFNSRFVKDYSVLVADNGIELIIKGGIKNGLAREVETKLHRFPAIRTIVLDGYGIDVAEGKKLYVLFRDRRLNTVVNGKCIDVCFLAYLGGAKRWLGLTGFLGVFNSYAFPTRVDANQSIDSFLEGFAAVNGVPLSYVKAIFRNHKKDPGYLDRGDLIVANIVTDQTSSAMSSLKEIDSRLSPIWEKRKSTLPMAVDDQIYVTDYSVRDGIVTTHISYLDRAYEKMAGNLDVIVEMKDRLRSSICSVEETRQDIAHGVIYRFRFSMRSDLSQDIDIDISKCDIL